MKDAVSQEHTLIVVPPPHTHNKMLCVAYCRSRLHCQYSNPEKEDKVLMRTMSTHCSCGGPQIVS